MRLLLAILCAAIGVILGLGATYLVMARGISFDEVELPGWEFVPKAGAPDIDPYRRARIFVEGELPLASGEGFVLRANHDSEGTPLSGACTYQLKGPFPVARFWTMVLYDQSGRTFTNPAGRIGFTSAEILRSHDGAFAIEIGPQPLAGNWLPSPQALPFLLILRFYETPLSASATVLDPRTLPAIVRIACLP